MYPTPMISLVDITRSTVARHDMLSPGHVVVVMLSGGADSVALTHLLASGSLGAGLRVSALHVNHMLRGADADDDESFARDLCERLELDLRVVRFDVGAYAAQAGLNLEDAGRKVRYRFAAEEVDARCDAADVPLDRGRITVGHTRDDRLETFVMRLSTGAGTTGLTSLRPVRGRIVRPLSDCPRALVREYLMSVGESWREDTSNTDTTRLRARARHELLPLLREINPLVDEALARTLEILTGEDDFLADAADALARDIVTVAGGQLRFDPARMVSLPLPMRRRAVRAALASEFPEASRLEFDHIEALVQASADPESVSFARDLPGGLRAFSEYGTIIVSRAGEGFGALAPSLLLTPGTAELGEVGLLCAEEADPGEVSGDADSALIDADRVTGTLSVAGPRIGERMRSLGMTGTKKLSDLLVDAKVPARLRPVTPVVRDGERVVWIAGVRMSEDYKVTPSTTRAVRLTWERPQCAPHAWRRAERTRQRMHRDIDRVILTEDQIRTRIAEMGEQISADYGDEPLLLVAVLRGATLFIADLARSISSPVEVDFMAVSSYGSSTRSSGVVRIIKDLDETIEGCHVLVIEDILDTGLTLKYLLKNLASRNPASLEVVTLLSKEGKQRVPISCKYVGFDIADEFVVGYGLDYGERYRNLPYIGVLKPEVYSD